MTDPLADADDSATDLLRLYEALGVTALILTMVEGTIVARCQGSEDVLWFCRKVIQGTRDSGSEDGELMFGAMAVAATCALVAAEHAQKIDQAEWAAIEALPEAQRTQARADKRERDEKRRLEAIAERRHQEVCQAIRDSRSPYGASYGVTGFLLGLAVGSAID